MHRLQALTHRPVVNLLVAHMPEAKPLIKQFGLQPESRTPHPLFVNEAGISLCVTGNGARAMALACAHLAGRQQEIGPAPAWVNIGIAGHGCEPVGTGLLINKIISAKRGRNYYPTPSLTSFPVSGLQTVNRVEREYREHHAYDMEGAAFWEAATVYGQLDFVQLFKIVSDNPEQHVDGFDLESIPGLIANQEAKIAELVTGLHRMAIAHLQVHDLPDEFYELVNRMKFSATQYSQLQKLFQRWSAFGKKEQLFDLIGEHSGHAGNSKNLLQVLSAELRRLEPGSEAG